MAETYCSVFYVFSSTSFAACETSLSAADNMMFDKRKISVDSSCEKFVINFEHKGKMPTVRGHNVVIIKTDDFNTVVKKIDMKLGAETGFPHLRFYKNRDHWRWGKSIS